MPDDQHTLTNSPAPPFRNPATVAADPVAEASTPPGDVRLPSPRAATLPSRYSNGRDGGGEGLNTSAPGNGGTTAEFLSLLFGDVPNGVAEITYLAPEGADVDRITVADPEGGLHHPKTVVDWRALPLGMVDPRMKHLGAMNRRGYGVYVAPVVRRERKQGEWRTQKDGTRYWCAYPRGTEKDALYITAFYTEADAKDFGGDKAEARRRVESQNPDILIDSGAGYHGYWLLPEPLEITDANRADVKRTLRGIAVAAGVPPEVADLARIMRLPGFVNTKPGRNGAVCEVVYIKDTRHSFSDLFTTFAPLVIVAPTTGTRSKYSAADDQQAEVIEALKYIPADTIEYKHGWIPILAALHAAFDEATAIGIAEQWSGWCSKKNEIADKMGTFDHYSGAPATLGTIFHMAKQFGYQRKTTLRKVDSRLDLDHTHIDHGKKRAPHQSIYFYAEGFAAEQWEAVFAAFGSNKSAHKLFLLVYEGLRQGLIDPLRFAVAHLLSARDELGVKLPDPTLRAAFRQFGELFSELQIDETTMCKSDNNSKRGPRDHHYAMLPRETMERNLLQWAEKRFEEKRHRKRGTTPNITAQMAEALSGDARRAALEVIPDLPPASDQARTSSWLARRDFSALARSLSNPHFVTIPLDSDDIRAAVLNADVDEETPLPRAEIERRFGISRANVLTKRAGLQAVEQTVDCPVTSPATFEREVYEARKAKRGFPVALIEVKPTGEQVQHQYQTADPEGNREVMEAAQLRGSAVHLRLRTANKYRRVEPAEQPIAEPVPKPARRAVSFHEPSEIRPYYGPGYNPTVVRVWLKTHLRRLKWREQDGRFTNPTTGEVFDLREQGFLEFAESLGAEVQVISA